MELSLKRYAFPDLPYHTQLIGSLEHPTADVGLVAKGQTFARVWNRLVVPVTLCWFTCFLIWFGYVTLFVEFHKQSKLEIKSVLFLNIYKKYKKHLRALRGETFASPVWYILGY